MLWFLMEKAKLGVCSVGVGGVEKEKWEKILQRFREGK